VPEIISGAKLSELFFFEAVRPLIAARFPGVACSAGLIGSGSEVLGFDTEMSRDHGWGPRVMLFLDEDDHAHQAAAIHELLRNELPHTFRGYPTSFTPPDPADHGTQLLQAASEGPVNHRVDLLTIRGFLLDYLNFDLERALEPADWLTFPEQKLRTLSMGPLFQDEIGLEPARARFAYYPHDVWLYLLACGWERIGQEEHLMGRAGLVGDEIGSALIGARLVRDLMRLCFLMERQYAPYSKWFGGAFSRLECASDLAPALRAVQLAPTWQERERHLVEAYEYVAGMHNRLGVTAPIPAQVETFFGRPFRVIWGGRRADALRASISDPALLRLARRRPIGGIDQFSDSTDLLEDTGRRPALRLLYEEDSAHPDQMTPTMVQKRET
jgi:Domain of unknown function (DUF4037)